MSIEVYDSRGICVMSGNIYTHLFADITDKIDVVKVSDEEYEFACVLLQRNRLTRKSFVFVGDDARTIYLNWN